MINTNYILNDFSKLDLDLFLNHQKIRGRSEIDQSQINRIKILNSMAKEVLDDDNQNTKEKETASFLSIITDTVTRLASGETSTYNTYVEVKLLEWYLDGIKEDSELRDEKMLSGLYFLSKDFLQFEVDTLEKKTKYFQKQIDNINFQKRIKLLKLLVKSINQASSKILGFEFESNYKSDDLENIVDFATEEKKLNSLVKFSCFPRTEYHDEYAFIRTIQISEFCFIRLKDLVKSTIDKINKNDHDSAKKIVTQACLYVEVLLNVSKVLRTMPFKPVNNFMFFREETGNASAIQSVSYQEFEILLYGIRKSKREIYEKVPTLNHLLVYENSKSRYNLKTVIKEKSIEDFEELWGVLKTFDNKFLKWKAIHLGFALSFLPKFTGGTGSTEGAPYLERIFKASIFS